MAEPNTKCYWPHISIVTTEKKKFTINSHEILSFDKNLLRQYSICCSDKPVFGPSECDALKDFLIKKCEEIDVESNNTSKLLLILLAYCSGSWADLNNDRSILSIEEIKDFFTAGVSNFNVEKVDFVEASERSAKFCRCDPGVDIRPLNDFSSEFNDILCSPTITPNPPQNPDLPPVDETDPPETDPGFEPAPPLTLKLCNIKYNNQCKKGNLVVQSEPTRTLPFLLNPLTTPEDDKLVSTSSYLFSQEEEQDTAAFSKRARLVLNPPRESGSYGSPNRAEATKDYIRIKCKKARATTYSLENRKISLIDISASSRKRASDYYNSIILSIPSSRFNFDKRVPPTFSIDYSSFLKRSKKFEEFNIHIYTSLESTQDGSTFFVIQPYNGFRVPIELNFTINITVNIDEVIVPFMVTKIEDPFSTDCEDITDTKELTLTIKDGDINKDYYNLTLDAKMTVYADYRLEPPNNNKYSTKIEKYPDAKIRDTVKLGSGDPIYHIKFNKQIPENVLKTFMASLPSDSLVDRKTNAVYLISKTDGETLRSAIKENEDIFIPAAHIFCKDNEVASRDNVEKWVNLNCRPEVTYVTKARYVADKQRTKAGARTSGDDDFINHEPNGGNSRFVSLLDQIEYNLLNKKFNITRAQTKVNHKEILTQQGIQKIKNILDSKVEDSTNCCCYYWTVGVVDGDKKYNYIPYRANDKTYLKISRTME